MHRTLIIGATGNAAVLAKIAKSVKRIVFLSAPPKDSTSFLSAA
jgi:hypothetical protein